MPKRNNEIPTQLQMCKYLIGSAIEHKRYEIILDAVFGLLLSPQELEASYQMEKRFNSQLSSGWNKWTKKD